MKNPEHESNSHFAVTTIFLLLCATLVLITIVGCTKSAPNSASQEARTANAANSAPGGSAASNGSDAQSGPVDVCGVITPQVAATVLGPLPPQPPSKTDNAGFGIYDCMYLGPRRSGQGAQTVFSRLQVSIGSGKDVPDLMQADADKFHATQALSGVGDEAKRNAEGSLVWARKKNRYCTAQMFNGIPSAMSPDQAAEKLGGLCQMLFAK